MSVGRNVDHPRQAGFTVLEVLASLSIFAIIAAGLAANSIAAVRANRTSRAVSVAGALAQDKMESLRASDPSTNPADLTVGSHNDPNNPLTATGQTGGRFNRQWTVTANTPSVGLYTVVVTVTWNDRGSRSVRVVGYVCPSQACI
jgi:prepilin-type N-terminal cleavage/methylation domain-containing protein